MNTKLYIITCSTDPYHASRSTKHLGREILMYNMATPVKWVHDDNCGLGYTLEEARRQLDDYYREDKDCVGHGGPARRHFELRYESDVWIFRIEELSEKLQRHISNNRLVDTVKAYTTWADIFYENLEGDFDSVSLDYDLQDRDYFDDNTEAEEWLKEEVKGKGFEYDKNKFMDVLIVLWNNFTK